MNYESLKLVNDNNKRVQQVKEQKKLKNKIKNYNKKSINKSKKRVDENRNFIR